MEQNEYREKFIMQLQINGKKLYFKISGAAVTIANKSEVFTIECSQIRLYEGGPRSTRPDVQMAVVV